MRRSTSSSSDPWARADPSSAQELELHRPVQLIESDPLHLMRVRAVAPLATSMAHGVPAEVFLSGLVLGPMVQRAPDLSCRQDWPHQCGCADALTIIRRFLAGIPRVGDRSLGVLSGSSTLGSSGDSCEALWTSMLVTEVGCAEG